MRNNKNGSFPIYGGNGISGYSDEYNIDKPTIVIGRVGFYCGSIHYVKSKAWVTDNAFITSIYGNVYDIVTIGNQQWFASNLKTTRYNNGVNIEFPENATDWESAGNSSIGSYTWYEGNEEFGEIYGAYYNC